MNNLYPEDYGINQSIIESSEWDSLSDNRDYTIFPAADQAGADEAKEYAAWAREEMVRWGYGRLED